MKIVGLDVGTTTISGVLIDTDSLTLLGSNTCPNTAYLKKSQPWEDAQDPEVIWSLCQQVLAQLSSISPKIDGIGVTGQMHGMVYLDAEGKAAGSLATWQDGRGNQAYRDGKSYTEVLSEVTACPAATGYGLVTHFYNLLNGLLPPQAASFCTIADYVAMRLCGRTTPAVHPSNAASFGLFDLHSGAFDQRALEKAGISASLLPPVLDGEGIIGCAPGGVPVCVSIGDNQASVLGSLNASGSLLVNIGTSSQISIISERTQASNSLEYRPYVGGACLLVGAGLCGGSAYQLVHDLFRDVFELYGVPSPGDLFAGMEAAAWQVYAGEGGLAVDTRFRGTRRQPAGRGSIQNIGLDNFTPGHLALGVLKGVCAEMKAFYDEIAGEFHPGKHLVGSGNALRKNALLRKILADTFEREVLIPVYAEEASLGAAILAASAVDGNASLKDLQAIIQYS